MGYANSLYEGTPYYMEDAGRDAAFGVILGAGLHVLPGAIGDHFRGLHETTPPLMGKGAIADLAKGEQVHSPGKIAELDASRAYDVAKRDPEITAKYGNEPKVYTPEEFRAQERVPGLSDTHNLPRSSYLDRRVNEALPEKLSSLNTGDKKFSNTYDRAAFLATSNQPKTVTEALAWLKEQTGLTDAQIFERGKEVRKAQRKGEAAPEWAAAKDALEMQRERQVEQALLEGKFVSPDRLKDFPALAAHYKDALPVLQKDLDSRLTAAGKDYTAQETTKAKMISAFNAEREAAIQAKRDQLLSEKGVQLSDEVQKSEPKKFTDPTDAEKNTPSLDIGEKELERRTTDGEAEMQALAEEVNQLKQDSSYVLDEGTLTELKELDGHIGDAKSVMSKMKELASCIWGAL
jgi:hypothetical protein